MRKGLLVNLDRCSGCDRCVVACKLGHGLGLGSAYNRVVAVGPTGTFPDVEKYWLPAQCQQCENPACIAACPTGASYRAEETGYVLVDQEQCIGCGLYITACPYGARQLNVELNVAQKCTLCNELTVDGSDVPVCVHNCNCGARFFGDFDDPTSDVCVEMAKYSDDCIHALDDHDGVLPVTRYILSPKYASWHGDVLAE